MRRLLSSLPSNHQRTWIPGGNPGTAATIRHMRDLVTHGKRDFRVRRVLKDVLAPCSSKDYLCYARAIHGWVMANVKFVFDPNGVELIEAPWEILQSRVGDCDSLCVLCATLYEQAGFPARFVTIMADSSRPDSFSHVFLEVNVPGHGWQGSDCSMPGKPFGWKPDEKHLRKEWPGSLDPVEDRGGDAMAGEIPVVSSGGFQQEPAAFVVTDPASLELAVVKQNKQMPVYGREQEFFTAPEAEEALRGSPAMKATATPLVQSGVTKLVLYGGLALALWGIFRGKR